MKSFRRPSISIPASLFMLLVSVFPGSSQDRGLTVLARAVTGNPDFDVGRQYAVIIGIDRYKEWPSLRSAVGEAKALKAVLSERYVIDEFFELYDEQATAAGIKRLFLETLPARLGFKDSLLVFYAGHGQTDASQTGFWIASDGSKDPYVQSSWIPNQQIRNMIGGLKAQRILILADACFSGDFLNVKRGASPTVDNAYIKRALQLTSRQVLTSGSSESVPDESEFGRQLLSLLQRNDQAFLDPLSMYDRLRLGVTSSLPLFGSLPGHEEGASYVLFLKSAVAPPAKRLGGLHVQTDPPGAELVVDGVAVGPSPYTLKDAELDRLVRVEARKELQVGQGSFTIAEGMTPVTIRLALGKGSLRVNLPEDARGLESYLDGTRLPEFNGNLSDIPAGLHRLEVRGPYLRADMRVQVGLGESKPVELVATRYGRLMTSLPEKLVTASLKVDGLEVPAGMALLQVGRHQLRLESPLIQPYEESIDIAYRGEHNWTPKPVYRTGSLVLEAVPLGVKASFDESVLSPDADGSITLSDCLIGEHWLRLEASYLSGGLSRSIVIQEGRTASFLVPQGRFSFEALPADARVSLVVGSSFHQLTLSRSADGGAESPGLLPGSYALSVSGRYLPETRFTVKLAEGGIVRLGRLSAQGELRAQGEPGGLELSLASPDGGSRGLDGRPLLLPPGAYVASIRKAGTKGEGIAIPLTINPGWTSELPLDLARQRLDLEARLAGRKLGRAIGWAGMSAAVLGAAGAGASYLLGSAAMAEYRAADTSATAAAARERASLYSQLLVVSAGIGGGGLLLGPGFLFLGPGPRSFQESIDGIDLKIRTFKEGSL